MKKILVLILFLSFPLIASETINMKKFKEAIELRRDCIVLQELGKTIKAKRCIKKCRTILKKELKNRPRVLVATEEHPFSKDFNNTFTLSLDSYETMLSISFIVVKTKKNILEKFQDLEKDDLFTATIIFHKGYEWMGVLHINAEIVNFKKIEIPEEEENEPEKEDEKNVE